jgi:predicted glycoside hydrolase/deacetylase ChbG (UPF0249 family)
MPKRLVVCADDYAFTPGVSRGIRELLEARRISATSVMTVSPYWPDEAAALKKIAGDADIGLHLTLTDQVPLGPMEQLAPQGRFPPMKYLYRAGIARRLPLGEIEREIDRQIARFIEFFGRPPAHIDGHHHVHQLPGVRSIVVRRAKAMPGGQTWVRSCNEETVTLLRRGVAAAKSMMIGALGGSVERLAKEHGVATNRGFTGAYDYTSDPRPFSDLAPRFILGLRDNGLMMTHPGYSDAVLQSLDVLTTARDAERAFLAGTQWPHLVASAGFEIGPLRRAARSEA